MKKLILIIATFLTVSAAAQNLEIIRPTIVAGNLSIAGSDTTGEMLWYDHSDGKWKTTYGAYLKWLQATRLLTLGSTSGIQIGDQTILEGTVNRLDFNNSIIATDTTFANVLQTTGNSNLSNKVKIDGNKSAANLFEVINDDDGAVGDSSFVISKLGGATMTGALDVQNTITTGNDAANISGQLNFVSAGGDAQDILSTTDDYLTFNNAARYTFNADIYTTSTKINVNALQSIYIPDQTNFTGTMIYGTGGGSLSHSAGSDGYYNTFIGNAAGFSNTTGNSNTFSGYQAGYSNSTGNYNTFSGREAGYSNTTGANNTFSGLRAGYYNTTGYSNTFSGREAGRSNTTGANNTFNGYYAGFSNTTGNYNTFSGNYAGLSNTTGANNTFNGYYAGRSNTTGANNTFSGNYAGYYNTTGNYNTFSGYYAGRYNEANSNTAFGYAAFDGFVEDGGSAQTFANTDIIVAGDTIYVATHGFGGVGIFVNLKWTATTGALPTGISLNQIDQFKITHADTIVLITDDMTDQGTGNHTVTPQEIYTNSTALGYNAEPDASNQIMLGDANVTEVKTAGGLTIGATTKVVGNLVSGTYNFAADAEASDTYVITLSPAPAAYTTGMMIVFTANTANTDGATVNVNGLGAKNILKMHDQAVITGDIEAGQVVVCVYDGTNMQMTSQVAQ